MTERIAEIIREFSAQGIHRTGTDVDVASALWLAGKMRALGADPIEYRFDFERVALQQNYLTLGDRRIDGVPMYDGTFTAPAGVTGAAGPIGSDAPVGVMTTSSHAGGPAYQQLNTLRESGAHKAIVLVTDDSFPPGAPALINAERFTRPVGPPVLQVPNNHASLIEQAVQSGEKVTVIAQNSRVAATGINIHCRVPGRDTALAPLVVMTPRSGWWTCASERGGGIAVLLEILRAITLAQPARDVIFTANTGHELGHTGLAHFLADNEALIRAAEIWLHLGANFGASKGGGARLQYSDDAARAAFRVHVEAESLDPAEAPVGARPGGEARNIFDGGGRFISIVGGNALFHHPDDVFPGAVDVDLTAQWVRAFVAVALSYARD